jgi:hypothetical protein
MITRRSMGLKKAFLTGFGSGVPHEGMDGVYVYIFLGGKPPSILLRNIGAHGVEPIVSTSAAQPEGRRIFDPLYDR